MERNVFGHSSGKTECASIRKDHGREDANSRWLCLTTMDLSQIKDADELVSLVRMRYGVPEAQAREQVEGWMRDKAP